MADRLRDATSPYLLQHAGNPVDWWPWSAAAFDEARRRDVPVLLSVGYSACHWCHVMAHESFEDQATADLVNEHLVAIKVDREERPDVDTVYMTATQAMTGQGGWPMTVFLTPDKEPFYCGTYFPREYFNRLVLSVAKAWRENRPGILDQARQITLALAETAAPAGRARRSQDAGLDLPPAPAAADAIPAGLCEAAVAGLAERYDLEHGGYGGAPKFPPSTVLEFLIRHSERAGKRASAPADDPAVVRAAERDTPAAALAMAVGTARAMARGGMYDQLAGGFARYSVDAEWVVPHFEKMLYDNAQLARIYTHLWRRTSDPLARRVAEETCGWMIAELATAEGGLASALDADSDGEEGAFYVWTPAQLAEALRDDDGRYAAALFAVTAQGTFDRGASVLQLPSDPEDQQRYQRVRAELAKARAERVRPARDDKVVAAWNGLAIAGLAEAGLLLGRGDFTAAATSAAELLARVHLADGRLARTSRDGIAGHSAGVLDDYACVAEGFIALAAVTGEARWVELAGRLLDTVLERFSDENGFHDTADDSEQLIYRPADPADGPTPSGAFAAAGALLSYSALTGSDRHRQAAAGALAALPAIAARYPQAAGWGLAVAEAFIAGPVEIAVAGPPGDQRTGELHYAAAFGAPPGAVIALGTGAAQPAGGAHPIALLAGRGMVDGQPAAYVCRNFTCAMPVTTATGLLAVLGR